MPKNVGDLTISLYKGVYGLNTYGPEDCLNGQGLKALAAEVAVILDGKMGLTFEEVEAIIKSNRPAGCLKGFRKKRLTATLALLLDSIVTRCWRENIPLERVAEAALDHRRREYARETNREPAEEPVEGQNRPL